LILLDKPISLWYCVNILKDVACKGRAKEIKVMKNQVKMLKKVRHRWDFNPKTRVAPRRGNKIYNRQAEKRKSRDW
tara:strand:- start:6237 stop:6464 length:228 start_codon:yes stop_codon:yes gene_type:complete